MISQSSKPLSIRILEGESQFIAMLDGRAVYVRCFRECRTAEMRQSTNQFPDSTTLHATFAYIVMACDEKYLPTVYEK